MKEYFLYDDLSDDLSEEVFEDYLYYNSHQIELRIRDNPEFYFPDEDFNNLCDCDAEEEIINNKITDIIFENLYQLVFDCDGDILGYIDEFKNELLIQKEFKELQEITKNSNTTKQSRSI